MINNLRSPGVLLPDQDLSYYTRGTDEASTAIITPTVKGAKFVPAKVYSFEEYDQLFGSTFISGSLVVEYFGSISAREFFTNGGTSLLVVPIATGSFTPASSSVLNGLPTASVAFTLETLSDGSILNSGPSEVTGSLGLLTNGTQDNIRWEVVDTNTAKGTFTLLVRRGDDTSKNKIVLEEFTNLTLDPTSTDYISARIGDVNKSFNPATGLLDKIGSYDNNSTYVRVSSVVSPTPNYFDGSGVAKAQFTGSLPPVASGSFGGGGDGKVSHPQLFFRDISAVNSQGFGASTSAYNTAIDLLANPDEYQFDILTMPGITAFTHPLIVAKAQAMVESRADCLFIVDMVPFGYNPVDAINQSDLYDSNKMATYYCNWFEVASAGMKKFVPESTLMPSVFAYSRSVDEFWAAPAGYNRGGLPSVTNIGRKLLKSDLDALYDNGVNPITKTIKGGTSVQGQKTLQKRASATDRVNVALLLIDAKRKVKEECNKILFEQDTETTRNKFLSAVRPYFDSLQERQGLYAYRVIMDDTTNSNESIDRNILQGVIQLKPTKTIEYIIIPFELYPTGAVFKDQ